MNNKKRGAFLKKARESKKLTQEELGRLIFYSDKTISAWEKGIYTPSDYETIIKLSEVLEISPLSIIYGEDNTTEQEQIYSYFNYQKQTKLKLIIISIIFLITLIIILISFYLTNLRDTTSIYNIITNRDDIVIRDSFYIYNRNTSILSLNKIIIPDNKYYINKIELFFRENNKRIKIMSGPNENYYLENNNRVNEYSLKDLIKKKLYLRIYTGDKEIQIRLLLTKKDKLLSPNNVKETKRDANNQLENLGFIYKDEEYIMRRNNITIRYNEPGILSLIKENKDNNEYLNKRINNDNITYKKIYSNGKYKEKIITTKEYSLCNLQEKTDINQLSECLNYLAKELKK